MHLEIILGIFRFVFQHVYIVVLVQLKLGIKNATCCPESLTCRTGATFTVAFTFRTGSQQ